MLTSKLAPLATIVAALFCIPSIQAAENPRQAEIKTNHRLSVEAISNLGTLNRAQEAYLLENGRFASKMDQLDALISGKFYSYTIVSVSKGQAIAKATPKTKGLKPVIAGVVSHGNEQFQRIICESKSPGFSISNPKLDGAKWICGAGSSPVE